MLQTDTRVGLTSEEVLQRRRKFGLNQMKEEKENLLLKFLGFFVGPIQFVMEVRFDVAPIDVERCFVSSTVAVGATTRGRSRRNETMPFPTSTPTRL
jgi:magnesium-transporting ATPase (P-type)